VLEILYPVPKFANSIERRNFVKEYATIIQAAPITIHKNYRRISIRTLSAIHEELNLIKVSKYIHF
jgi:hypothetical protein